MLDPRIYRAAFLPVIAAVVALMFSLEPAPEPIEGPVSTPTFEGRQTARIARSIAERTPSRTPGSEGDRALAERVRSSFAEIEGAELGEQTFEGSHEGEDVELENVLLTLPGSREEVLLVVAGRDTEVGQGASTSAAATAILLQLADDLGNARRERTIVLASVPGSAADPDGIGELVDSLPAPAGIDAALTVVQPGVRDREPPFVFAGRSGPETVPAPLLITADQIASVQFGTDADPRGGWQQLARLALPIGIGEAAALAEKGLDAIAISGSGERPPPPDETAAASVSADTVFAVGSTALDLLLTLDERTTKLDAGPSTYLRFGDSLLPTWPLALLALALLLPALLASGDVWLRDRRRNPRSARRSLPWAIERALLPLAALIFAYGLGVIGLIPDPPFPYDPGQFPPGAEGPLAFALLALAVGVVSLLVRPMRTPLDVEPHALAAACGLLCGIAVLGIWLLNPVMALLLTPAAHVWLLPARAQGPPRPSLVAAAALLALVPIAVATLLAASGVGLDLAGMPWYVLILIVSGQVGLPTALLWCLLLGGLLACVAAARGGVPVPEAPEQRPPSLRGPGGHAGPGSLGGVPSSLLRS